MTFQRQQSFIVTTTIIYYSFCLYFCCYFPRYCFATTLSQQQQQQQYHYYSSSSSKIHQQHRSKKKITSVQLISDRVVVVKDNEKKRRRRTCNRCPRYESTSLTELEESQEVLYTMMGSLWSMGILSENIVFPATAEYDDGIDAKMSFLDIIQGLLLADDRKNTKQQQCLVDESSSLGNHNECLVYNNKEEDDKDKLLYNNKGADIELLLRHIQTVALALENDIPLLVERKQWTKITDILTGPKMGQLSSTLSSLQHAAAQVIKQDILDMGSGATLKKPDIVMKYRQKAINDLTIFLSKALLQ